MSDYPRILPETKKERSRASCKAIRVRITQTDTEIVRTTLTEISGDYPVQLLEVWAAVVKVIRIPCFGRRMTIGRGSIVWPGVS